jgi:hypothetical protein
MEQVDFSGLEGKREVNIFRQSFDNQEHFFDDPSHPHPEEEVGDQEAFLTRDDPNLSNNNNNTYEDEDEDADRFVLPADAMRPTKAQPKKRPKVVENFAKEKKKVIQETLDYWQAPVALGEEHSGKTRIRAKIEQGKESLLNFLARALFVVCVICAVAFALYVKRNYRVIPPTIYVDRWGRSMNDPLFYEVEYPHEMLYVRSLTESVDLEHKNWTKATYNKISALEFTSGFFVTPIYSQTESLKTNYAEDFGANVGLELLLMAMSDICAKSDSEVLSAIQLGIPRDVLVFDFAYHEPEALNLENPEEVAKKKDSLFLIIDPEVDSASSTLITWDLEIQEKNVQYNVSEWVAIKYKTINGYVGYKTLNSKQSVLFTITRMYFRD